MPAVAARGMGVACPWTNTMNPVDHKAERFNIYSFRLCLRILVMDTPQIPIMDRGTVPLLPTDSFSWLSYIFILLLGTK